MNKTIWLILATGFYILVSPSLVGAVGVAVNPAEITMEAVVGEVTSVRIKVSNPSTDVAVFEVYPDDFAKVIRANPSSFTLESGAEQQVAIEVRAPESGQFSTLLSVVGRPLASNAFQAGSGVKVPLTVIAKPGANGLALVFTTLGDRPWISIVVLAALIGWIIYRRRQIKTPAV